MMSPLTQSAVKPHPDEEALAAFVDGQLKGDELAAVARHLLDCEECRGLIGEAVAFEHEESTPAVASRRRRNWLPLASAAVIAVVVGGLLVPGYLQRRAQEREESKREELKRDLTALFAFMPRGKRMVEARFSGQTSYGPYSPTRGKADEVDFDLEARAALEARAYKVIADAGDNRSSEARRAAAAAFAILGEPDEALARLNEIPEAARDALVWNQIAAVHHSNNDDKDAALAVDHALKIDPKMPEALFTKAVILHMNASTMAKPTAKAVQDARDAWMAYLAVDSNSRWADDARIKLADLDEFK